MSEDKPAWLVEGARVQKCGRWPRVNLPDGAIGTVHCFDTHGFYVHWDDHEGYESMGVFHPFWHSTHGNVVSLDQG